MKKRQNRRNGWRSNYLKYEQNYVNVAFLSAYFDAWDEARRTGKSVSIAGFGGWFVSLKKKV